MTKIGIEFIFSCIKTIEEYALFFLNELTQQGKILRFRKQMGENQISKQISIKNEADNLTKPCNTLGSCRNPFDLADF